MYDIIIIGAGPAGLTAALYALRANKKVLILEAKSYGGQILKASKIENYPGIKLISGYDYATNLYNQVTELNGEIKYETVLRVDADKTVTTNKSTYQAKSVIIATGSDNRKLNIDGENEFVGKGVSYCATCDGNFFRNKTVAVIGGGNSAFQDAIYLSEIASKVYLIHRRDEFRADEKEQDIVSKSNNIMLITNAVINKIIGDDFVKQIEINKDGNISTLDVDGIFISIGQEPKNNVFSNMVELDKLGYIISEDGVHTKTPGIYVAGDTRQKELRQLTTAVSDGSIAATVAIREMNNNK